MIRPEMRARILRWREHAILSLFVGAGLWLSTRGGPVIALIGLGVAGLAAGLLVGAVRRDRFRKPVDSPGLVEVDEAQIAYFGPVMGGALSLRELSEIRLAKVQGRLHWRLKQGDGQALMIPVAAEGSPALYDAFATLPGIDMQVLAAAQASPPKGDWSDALWRRPARIGPPRR